MDDVKFVASLILLTIKKNKVAVLSLLNQYGVTIPNKAIKDDEYIALQVTNLARRNNAFKGSFWKLMNSMMLSGAYNNMSGYSNTNGRPLWESQYTNWDITKNTTPSSGSSSTDTSTPKSSGSTGSSSWLTTGLNLLQSGWNGYLQLDENKTKRELAGASVNVKASDVDLAKLGQLNPPPPKSNTALYVVLGVLGVSLVGVLVYLGIKNKK